MKTITLIAMVGLMSIFRINAQTGLNYNSCSISSLVGDFGHYYSYTYTFNLEELNYGKKDLSHITLYICDSFTLFDLTTTDNVQIGNLLYSNNQFKFDDISDNQPEIWSISFNSISPPKQGELSIKYGKYFETKPALVPSCNIPEPDTSVIGLIGLILLLKRRRK